MTRRNKGDGWNKRTIIGVIGLILGLLIAGSTLLLFAFQTKTAAAEHKGEFNTHVEKRTVLDVKQDMIDMLQNDNHLEYNKTLKELKDTQTNIRENIIKLMTEQGMRREVVPLPPKDP